MWKPVPRHEPDDWGRGDGDNNGSSQRQASEKLGEDEVGPNSIREAPEASTHSSPEISDLYNNGDRKPELSPTVKRMSKNPATRMSFASGDAGGRPEGKNSLFQRIGKRALLLVVPSAIFVFAAIGFLAWLWYGNRTEERWRRLMIGGWSNQAITISALVLRTALSIFAGIATSMIASISLERGGASLRDALRLSVARFTSPGPDAFWFETLFHRHFVDLPLRSLLFLLLLSTVAVQFSSTILLSDLGMGRVIGFPVYSKNLTGFSWELADYSPRVVEGGNLSWAAEFYSHHAPFQSRQEYWSSQPRTFNLFAEYSEPAVTGEEIIDDTGLTLRSFLPISDQNIRHNARNFSGLAPVLDTRVVCVRPELLNGTITRSTIALNLELPSVSDSVPELTTSRSEFQVEIPRISTHGHAWHVALLNTSVGGMLSSLDAASRQNISLTYREYPEDQGPNRFWGRVNPSGVWRTSNDEYACGVDLGNAYLIMDTTSHIGALDEDARYVVYKSDDTTRAAWLGTVVDIDPADKDEQPDYAPWVLGWVTVCFDSLPKAAQYQQIQDFEITASGTGVQSEPRTTFKSAEDPLDILSLREQLGAGNEQEDLVSRSILRLDSIASIRDEVYRSSGQWEDYCSLASEMESFNADATERIQWDPNIYNRTTYSWLSQMALDLRQPIAMCTGSCTTDSRLRSSTGMAVILDEIIRRTATNSPALAMQAVLTQILRETYYTWLIRFDYETEVETVPMVLVLIPLRLLGFWIVVGITVLHLGVCLIACVAFAALTETSFLNNGWQAVADIVNHEDGRRVIEQAGQMKDAEIEKWIRADESLRRRFIVRKEGHTSRRVPVHQHDEDE